MGIADKPRLWVRSLITILGLMVLLVPACDVGVEEERDCYYGSGFPPSCIRVAVYHLHPAWHPEGHQVLYVRPDPERQITALYIYDLSKGTERHVVDAPFSSTSSQAWSPDGEWIVFGNAAQIYKARPDGTDLTQLTFARENFEPAWSPDGDWIAYVDATPSTDQQGVWIMRPNGSDKQWLPYVRGDRPIWHPAGQKILTMGQIPGFEYRLFQHYVSDPTRRDTLNPNGHLGFVQSATYSPDGRFIAFDIPHNRRSDVFALEVATNHVIRLTGDPETSFGAYPAWSPDGRTIAFVNVYWREAVIWLMDSDGSNKRRMGPVMPPIDSPYR